MKVGVMIVPRRKMIKGIGEMKGLGIANDLQIKHLFSVFFQWKAGHLCLLLFLLQDALSQIAFTTTHKFWLVQIDAVILSDKILIDGKVQQGNPILENH